VVRRKLRFTGDAFTLRGNGSLHMWMFVAWIVFLLTMVLPWMIRQSQ
jgi:hypothetical protein